MNFSNVKTVDVRSAFDTIQNLKQDWLSITITRPEKSEDAFAITATIESSGDIRTVNFSDEWLTTSKEEPAGSLRRRPRKRKEKYE